MNIDDVVIDVIIPAYNEQDSIGLVVSDALEERVRHVVVVSNDSTDRTEEVARAAGAVVLRENEKGYGAACLKGIAYLAALGVPSDVVIFMDGDHADHADQISELLAPILEGRADLVIGSRTLGKRAPGSLTPHQRFGNAIATTMLRMIYEAKFTDLGPFRAIRMESLLALEMEDRNFGWTIEMQIKAAKHGMSCVEIPAHYRKRIGVSKVSGTFMGSILAGYKIIATLLKYA
ncbi:MAG: glycosyltransferase family 2 protein [Cryomorphaceae bacterium]